MNSILLNILRRLRDFANPSKPYLVPESVSRMQRKLGADETEKLKASLIRNYYSYPDYFPQPPERYLDVPEGAEDMHAHLIGRLTGDREALIPWISEFTTLQDSSILEIGCGTGSSTVAFAEQGAKVLALDVHPGSLKVAQDRLALHGLEARLQLSDGKDIAQHAAGASFDLVAMIAVLEHMTSGERDTALREAWGALKSGGYLVVQDTPNRLWYFDEHTAREHFFMWLPDDVAARYSRLTPRPSFNTKFAGEDVDMTEFARWGRGVSFHDFVLAWGMPPGDLPVVSSLELFLRQKTNTAHLNRRTVARRYEEMISGMRPEVHHGFFLKSLDLIFRKP